MESTNETMYDVQPAQLLQYPEKVKSVSKEGRKNLKQNSLYTLNYLVSGKGFTGKDLALGENKFIESGVCDNINSEPICRSKKKYTYVRNIPTGTIPPLNLSFYNATGCNLEGLTEGRGLIPALFEDVYDINPIEVTLGVSGYGNLGSDNCKSMTLPVGQRIYDQNKENKTWKWETQCTSGHHSMTETTDPILNKKIRFKNQKISNARLPGPLQLRENYQNCKANKKHMNYSRITLIIFLVSLMLLKFIS